MEQLKERIAFLFEDTSTPAGKLVDVLLLSINAIACLIVVLESAASYDHLSLTFEIIEYSTVSLFAIEYILRYWVASNKLKYTLSLMSFIDLLSILPTFLAFGDFRFLRIFRVFRVFRFARYLEHHVFFFGEVNRIHLHIARIVFTIFALIFVSSGLIYNIENQANPEIQWSFFDAIYFSIVTVTTVGFGDITPISFYGRLATLFIILSGIAIIPWHVGSLIKDILAFTGKRKIDCPQCGLEHHDQDAVHCKRCGAVIPKNYTVHDQWHAFSD